MLREKKFRKQTQATKSFMDTSSKYLSPVAKADLEYKAMKKTMAASKNFKSGSSDSFYKRGNASNISMATVFTTATLAGSPQLAMLLNDDSYIDSEEKLIDDFLAILEMDGHHLPTLVHLGKLYYDVGNYALCEYWLERAVKRGKGRGSDGGQSGVATYYGGATSSWSYIGWSILERVMRTSRREQDGKECTERMQEFSVFASSRGFECLSLSPVTKNYDN